MMTQRAHLPTRVRPLAGCALLIAAQTTLALAGGELKCGDGFKMSSNTSARLTCHRNSTVPDAKRAEKLSRKWLASASCSGHMVDPQASIAEAGSSGFLVTVRFACEDE